LRRSRLRYKFERLVAEIEVKLYSKGSGLRRSRLRHGFDRLGVAEIEVKAWILVAVNSR
jgi:hypothetical protein